LRHRWEDIFWFSFFHEAAHIVLHRKKDRFGDIAEDLFVETPDLPANPRAQRLEDEANRFAARTLIPPPYDRRIATLSLADVPAFAQMLNVAPAIVVGRMQHDGLVPFSQGNQYRRRLVYGK
jgi:HTH-type transcriptional regulator/antitoxin HigA